MHERVEIELSYHACFNLKRFRRLRDLHEKVNKKGPAETMEIRALGSIWVDLLDFRWILELLFLMIFCGLLSEHAKPLYAPQGSGVDLPVPPGFHRDPLGTNQGSTSVFGHFRRVRPGGVGDG